MRYGRSARASRRTSPPQRPPRRALATEALDALVAAYPKLLARHDGQSVFWRDGTVMRASDGRAEKSFDLLLKDASILDQFHLTYPRGRSPTPPALNEDPGRFRNEAFFHAQSLDPVGSAKPRS